MLQCFIIIDISRAIFSGRTSTFKVPSGQRIARPLLDRIRDLHYTTRFDSVRFAGLKGRILCRNARFNRKFDAVTRRTAFAHA
jgi:hypothetical protein